jgi:hypothetical protein
VSDFCSTIADCDPLESSSWVRAFACTEAILQQRCDYRPNAAIRRIHPGQILEPYHYG